MPDSSAAFSDDAVTCSVTQPLGAGVPASGPEESPPDVALRTATTATIPTTTATTSGTRLRPANTPPHPGCPGHAVTGFAGRGSRPARSCEQRVGELGGSDDVVDGVDRRARAVGADRLQRRQADRDGVGDDDRLRHRLDDRERVAHVAQDVGEPDAEGPAD